MSTTRPSTKEKPRPHGGSDCGCGCGGKADAPARRMRECVPCDLDRLCRNHYFTGKLLTARDLLVEQRYLRDKARLHHRVLHGWGVACGLRVIPHPNCPDLRVIVEPGVAIDPCGYEIVVPSPVEIELPRPSRRGRPPSPCPPEDQNADPYKRPRDPYQGKPASTYPAQPSPQRYGRVEYDDAPEGARPYGGSGVGGDRPDGPAKYGKPPEEPKPERYGHPQPQGEPQSYGHPQPGGQTYDNEPEPERKPCDPPEPCVPLTVCVRYAECEEEFLPAPFDECGCNGAERRQPNRICEGFVIELRCEEPKRVEYDCEGDCESLFGGALEPCPSPGRSDCIPLAFIEDYRPGETVVEARINNRDYRRLLPSTRLLEQVVRCLAERAPGQAPTRVKRMGWTHGYEYKCHDFFRFFTGERENEGSFEVTFEAPVRTDALHRTFQAFIVRHRGNGPSGPLELAPSRVWMSDDGLRCWLQVDRSWAERELDDTRFDVYLTLRCGLLLDQQGRPVDGDLLARLVQDDKYVVSAPTGDGVPGGNLESWICVRP